MPGWFRCFDARPFASTRLICFPHAGGSAVFFRPLAKAAPPGLEVHAVQYPGRADRLKEPLIDDARRLAAAVADALAPLPPVPVALFGHSMGTIVAYETARLLTARGTPPAHLFVSASDVVPRGGRRGGETHHDKDDDALMATLARLGGTDVRLLADPQIRGVVLPYVRNDFRLVAAYRHESGPLLDCPVTAFTGDADPVVEPEDMAGWARTTSGGFTLRVLPGDHFYLIPQADAVLTEIRRRLAPLA